MTTRHAGYVVVLNDDLREDDAQATINALLQIKGVASVQPVEADSGMLIAKERVRQEYREKIIALLRELS